MACLKSLRSDLFCPNVTGFFEPDRGGPWGASSASGAFSMVYSNHNLGQYSSETGQTKFDFNAHNSNSAYTDNGHIYPLSLCLNYIVKC